MIQFPTQINNVTYDDFCDCIESLKNWDNFVDKLEEITNGGIVLWEIDALTGVNTELVHFLAKALNDDTDSIMYFLYELEYGENYTSCDYDYQGTGEIIETPLRNAKELWLFLALDNQIIDKNQYQTLLLTKGDVV